MSKENDNDKYQRWLAQIASGGPQGKAAFELLHDEFQKDVLRQVWKRLPLEKWGNAVQPEVAQDVWMKIWDGGAAKYKEKYPPAAWIKVLAKRHTLNFLKKKDNKLDTQELDESTNLNLYRDLSEEELAEDRDCFEWAVEQMEGCCKDCEALIKAKILDDLSNEKLAEMRGTTLRAATQKLYECRQCLRALIERC